MLHRVVTNRGSTSQCCCDVTLGLCTGVCPKNHLMSLAPLGNRQGWWYHLSSTEMVRKLRFGIHLSFSESLNWRTAEQRSFHSGFSVFPAQ